MSIVDEDIVAMEGNYRNDINEELMDSFNVILDRDVISNDFDEEIEPLFQDSSLNISVDHEKTDTSFNELLLIYRNTFERNKILEKEIQEKEKEVCTLKHDKQQLELASKAMETPLSVNEQKDKDLTEKEMEIGILKREKEEMVKKSQDMEKMLQEEIGEHDKLKRMGERERIELNEKNRELDEKLFMKETTLKQELKINKENIEHIEEQHKKDKQTEQQLLQEKHQSIQNEHVEKINELSGRLEDSEKRLEEKEYDMKEKDNTIKELEDLLKRLKEEEGSSKEKVDKDLKEDDVKKDNEQDNEEIRKSEEMMKKEMEEKEQLREQNKKQEECIVRLQGNIQKKTETLKKTQDRIRLLEESVGEYMDENVKCKNENKVYQQRIKNLENKDEHATQNKEINKLKEDFNKFKNSVSKELTELKGKVSSENIIPRMKSSLSTENRFSSLRFTNNAEEEDEHTSECSSDEGDADVPKSPRTRSRRRRKQATKLNVMPGLGTYSQAVADGKKNVVFSTSLTRDIDVNDFNRCSKEGIKTHFIRFRGKKICHIKNYLQTHLTEEKPDSTIILAGGNDLPVNQVEHSPVAKIAEDVIEAGRICKQNGANSVAISSIPPRESFHFQIYRKELNDLLRVLCERNGFEFIDNKNIILKDHVLRDGVHLNMSGTELLRQNFLSHVNNIMG